MNNEKDYRPILVVPTVPIANEGIRFLCSDCQLDIHGEIITDLWKIFSLCNGYHTIEEIANLLSEDREFVVKIIGELSDKKVIRDSREQYLHFHSISNNPQKYVKYLDYEELKKYRCTGKRAIKEGTIINFDHNKDSVLYKLQLQRKSCRQFSEKKLTISQIGNICDYAYSLLRHTVPSGGALYPLKIYCIIPLDQVDIGKGYYEFDTENSKLILFNKEPDVRQLQYCYNDNTVAFNSPVQIIIGADIKRQPFKYSNMGYRLTLIEVGQVAQNVALYCTEQGISTCELGGILNQELAYELDILEEDISPILGIAIGYKGKTNLFSYSDYLAKLVKKIVGENKAVYRYGVNTFKAGEASFFGAWSQYGDECKQFAGATGTSYYEAACKAIIEAYERFQSSKQRVDYYGLANNTKYFFLPNEIAPLTDEQRERMGLIRYYEDNNVEWVKDISGNYYIPTDFVFYGHSKKNKLFFGNSSGVAAFSNYEEAKKRAVFELIERDAILRCWYGHIAPKHVATSILSCHLLNRISFWKERKREVHVLALEVAYIPTFLVVIVSNDYPCFVSGSACILDSNEDAMNKALQEAEYQLLLALKKPIHNCPKIEEIKTPMNHGQYYHFADNMKKIKWLWSRFEETELDVEYKYDMKKIYEDLEVVFVDLSEREDSIIKVVRAISRKTITLSFGYKRDYYLHPEIQKLTLKSVDIELPHFYA